MSLDLAFLFCSAALVSAILPVHAHAADCRQADAIYADRDGAYELRFQPIGSQTAAASNRFTIGVANTTVIMDGYVMSSEDPERSNGLLMFRCPEGDVTGADLDACTVWQGMVYGADAKGDFANLPGEEAGAAERVLFAGLGPAIRVSSVWGKGKATVAPWDLLTFKGCAK
ncbi:hypothetical protein [Rhizobium sp. RAF56]|jgi:hypothetical protein|uniref:hypothetical protein n=1 Tax=Rhizobium sp. RAF56 TaxID=3233062 RepID=UPI003F94B6F6